MERRKLKNQIEKKLIIFYMKCEEKLVKYTNLVNPTLKNLKRGNIILRSPVIAKQESCSLCYITFKTFLFIILVASISRLVVLQA